MPEAKSSRQIEAKPVAVGQEQALALDALLCELDNLLELIAVKASMHSDTLDDQSLPSLAVLRAARRLVDRRLKEMNTGTGPSTSEESAAHVEDAWRRAVIETQEGRAHELKASPSEGDRRG